MSERRTIFDIYRQKDFSRKPPSDAWNRLEKKLGEQPIHRRLYFWNKFSIAASFLLLISMAFLANYMMKTYGNHQQFASLGAPAEMVEDLEYLGEFREYAEELATMKAYRDVFEAYFDSGTDESAYAHAETASDQDKSFSDFNYPKPHSPIAISESSRMNSTKMKMIEEYSAESLSDDFQQFSWLKGEWVPARIQTGMQTSWVVKDSNLILGKGYKVEGDDTLVFDKIALKKIGSKIYLVDENPSNPDPVNYELAYAQADTQWVFSGAGREIFINHKPGAHYKIFEKKHASDQKNAFGSISGNQGIFNESK